MRVMKIEMMMINATGMMKITMMITVMMMTYLTTIKMIIAKTFQELN